MSWFINLVQTFNCSLTCVHDFQIFVRGADVIKKIYSQLRNFLFMSLDTEIVVRSKIWEPLVTPNTGILNF